MSAGRERTILRVVSGEKPFTVVCRRADGRLREWLRYATKAEALQVARHLTSINCLSHVVDRDGKLVEAI